MDQTIIFKEILQNIDKDDKKPKISNKKNGNIDKKLRELVSSITYMRDYLIANKKDYVNYYDSILSMTSSMTDEERDQIDRDVEDFAKLCNDVIKILRAEVKSRISKQQLEHETIAINFVEAYIKTILELHNFQKASRLKRNLNSQNLFSLSRSVEKSDIKLQNSNSQSSNSDTEFSSADDDYDNYNALNQTSKKFSKNENNTNKIPENNDRKLKINKNFFNDCLENEKQSSQNDLLSEEQKLFKTEGNRIYDDMNLMNQEVKDIAKKLTEISKLQEIFTDNVIKQDSDLNNLNISTIKSTEYIREGNEQLREAMRKNAGFRVWILFFITTLAFVILFLDWYNN